MIFPYPKWIQKMPEGEKKDRAKNRFILRLCCLYAHPQGHIHNLAELLDMNPDTLKTQIQSERIIASEYTKNKIKRVLGPEFVPPYSYHIQDRRFKD